MLPEILPPFCAIALEKRRKKEANKKEIFIK
jgi:hypothetical protein